MRYTLILLTLCALLLGACTGPASPTVGTSAQLPTSTPVTEATANVTLPDFGTTTYVHSSDILNFAAREQFLAAYQEGKPGRWEEISYTDEGDPISYQLEYEGSGTTLRFVYDTTQDKFGSQQVTAYTCQQLIEDERGLRLLGCDGAEQEEFIIP